MHRLLMLASLVAGAAFAVTAFAQDISEISDPVDTTLAAPSSPDDGLLGQFGVRLAYNSERGGIVGASYRNDQFMQRDQSLGFAFEVSEDDSRFAFDYQNENMFGGSPRFGLNIYRTETRSNEIFRFDTTSLGIEPSLRWDLSERLTAEAFLSYSRNEVTDIEDDNSILIDADEGDRTRTAAGLRLNYEMPVSDSGFLTAARFTFEQEFGSTSRDTSYAKSVASVSVAGAAREGAVLFAAQLRGGNLAMSDGNSSVGDRFLLGQSSLRGFAYGGIGPRDLEVAGDPALGGNTYVVARFDTYFPELIGDGERIIPGLFFAAGALWSLDDINGGDAGSDVVDDGLNWRSSIGVSLRVNTGIGPIRINLTHPLESEIYDRTETFQLSFERSF